MLSARFCLSRFLLLVCGFGLPHAGFSQCALSIPSGAVTLSNNAYSYCSVSLAAGATLVIGGAVTLNVTGDMDLEGAVDGLGLGGGSFYGIGPGPGAGFSGSTTVYTAPITDYIGGSGASHWGQGGTETNATPAPTYDSPAAPASMGSEGGYGWFNVSDVPQGGTGGALLVINAPAGGATLNGPVNLDGAPGDPTTIFNSSGAGGGSGGALWVQALSIAGSGLISAQGGAGGKGNGQGMSGGGGGGGGLVRLCAAADFSYTGAVSVDGGAGGYEITLCSGFGCITETGPAGMDGIYSNCAPTPTATPTVTSSPTVGPTATFSPTPVPTATLSPTASPTASYTPGPSDGFFVSKNVLEPGSGPVSIWMTSASPGPMGVRVYNSAGEFVEDLGGGAPPSGQDRTYLWDGRNGAGADCASGIYVIYAIRPRGTNEAKILLLR